MSNQFSIIYFSMSPYSEWAIEKKANRNWHVIKTLEKHPQVSQILTVDFLPFSFRRALRVLYRDRLRNRLGDTVFQNLTTRCAKVSEKVYAYTTIDSIFSLNSTIKRINETAQKLGFANRVAWSCVPLFAEYLDTTEHVLTVFDAVDNWAEHPTYAAYKQRLLKNYGMIGKKSDIIFSVAQHIIDTLFPGHPHAHHIPNGVDAEHYRKPMAEPAELAAISHPRIGYVGVIQKRVDLELIARAAKERPNYQFIFVGPVWPDADVSPVKELVNVHFISQQPYESLPGFMQHFDVCVIPHTIDEFVKSMNPLKLYEYLAAGKPVVTTGVAGLEPFKGLVHVAQTPSAFISYLDQALTENSPDEVSARQQSADTHTWKSRIEAMVAIIDERLSSK